MQCMRQALMIVGRERAAFAATTEGTGVLLCSSCYEEICSRGIVGLSGHLSLDNGDVEEH